MKLARATPALLALLAVVWSVGCGGEDDTTASASRSAPIPRNLIVPEQGMAGVRLRMTADQVRTALGRPDQVRREGESETGVPILSWRYRREGLTVDLHKWGKRFMVGEVTADRAPPRTSAGVGVGSTEAEVKRALQPISCSAADPGTRWCIHGEQSRLGGRQTDFRVRHGRVYEVWVGIVFP